MNIFGLPYRVSGRKWLLFIALIATPVASNAMEINDFVADSISAHPEILEQIHVFREVNQDRDIADSGWLPSVDLSASAGTYETESPSIGPVKREYESTRAELSLTQNLFNGFDTEHQQQQTKARASSALYEIFDTADNIALLAVQLYLDLLKQQELVKLAEVNVSSHERILAQIRERNESGVGRQSELQQTEGRVARAHAGHIAQQNNLQDAASQLHEMLGRNVELTELKLPETPDLSELPLEELTDIALEKHPAIRVANYNIQAALSDSSRARYNNYPRVDLRLAKEVGDDLNGIAGDTDQLSLVLNLSYNLYRGGADKANQRKKISVVHQSQEFSSRVRRQAINTLRLAWVADQSLTSQLRYLNTHIVKARETVASYGEEFFIGQRDLVDLLDAESELNTAKNQYAVAYYDSIAARYRVLEAMGELFPALSLKIEVGEDDLQISKVKSSGGDILPLAATTQMANNASADAGKVAAVVKKSKKDASAMPGYSLELAKSLTDEADSNAVIENKSTTAIPADIEAVELSGVSEYSLDHGQIKPEDSMLALAAAEITVPQIQAKGEDELPLDPDRDADKEENETDHCDNTKSEVYVDSYGCHDQIKINFGYDSLNAIPIVGDDELHVEMNSVLVITQSVLMENDIDADNDTLRLVDFTQPAHGNLAFDAQKNIIYRAADGFTGTDGFSYTVSDGQGAVVSAYVKLVVEPKSEMRLTKTQFVNFIYKSSKLTPASSAKVESIVEMIKNLPGVGIEIYCYTDNIANESYNQALSNRRAEATRNLLISFGVDGNRIKAFGMGENNPIADNSTDEGRAINRRGEIQFIFSAPAGKESALLPKKLN